MTTLASFTGRQRLTRDDQLVSWSVYGLLEILETRYTHEKELIKTCKEFLESLERFVKHEKLSSH